MKAQHRHELQTNALATWLEETSEKLKPYARAILGVIVAIAIIFAVYAYVSALERRGLTQASEQLITAMQLGAPGELQTVIEEHRGTQPAAVAQLLLAEQLLATGADALYSDKPTARENLLKASDAFQSAAQEIRDPMLRSWALYGAGRAHESMGDLDRARKDYEALVKEYRDSALVDAARSHLTRLNQMPTKEFYDWFAKQEPRPPAPEKEPGAPGSKPLFDFTDPNVPGDVKLPMTPGSGATSGSTPAGETPAGDQTNPESGAPAGSQPDLGKPDLEKSEHSQSPATSK